MNDQTNQEFKPDWNAPDWHGPSEPLVVDLAECDIEDLQSASGSLMRMARQLANEGEPGPARVVYEIGPAMMQRDLDHIRVLEGSNASQGRVDQPKGSSRLGSSSPNDPGSHERLSGPEQNACPEASDMVEMVVPSDMDSADMRRAMDLLEQYAARLYADGESKVSMVFQLLSLGLLKRELTRPDGPESIIMPVYRAASSPTAL